MGLVTDNKPHARYPHVYVVIRIDTFEGSTPDVDEMVVTSVFGSQEEADAEVNRLKELAEHRGVKTRYISRIGRLKSPPRSRDFDGADS